MKHTLRHSLECSALSAALLLALSGPAAAQANTKEAPAASPELDFNGLRQRVRALETSVGELQALNLPVDVDVNCSGGASINNVLATHANGLGRLTIRIAGTCTETVDITRGNVAIIGNGTGATVQAPTPQAFAMLVANGASNVAISNLRLTGGQGAVAVSKNANAVFSNIVVEGTNLGLVAADNGTLEVTGSTLRNNTFGAFASRRGVILISNSTVENNVNGLLAFKGGLINATSLAPDDSTGPGVIVRNNVTGGISRSGGVLELSDSRVEANRGAGLLVDSSSALQFFNTLNGTGNAIVDNQGVGVLVQRTASVVFTDATTVVTGNTIGVLCQPNSGFVPPPGGLSNVNGNASGNVVGCVP